MITVYVEKGCGYSAKVLEALRKLGLQPQIKDIYDVRLLHELIMRGGKDQVPYLVDDDHGREMYDSDVIVDYLNTTYGTKPY